MKVAVIDLGTNTCNLLIVETTGDGRYNTLHNSKIPVKLGRGGIHKDLLLPDAIERGKQAIAAHLETIQEHGVTIIKAFATSAVRTATNGIEFQESIERELGVSLEIISGDREAELICKGVRQTYASGEEKYLILDIGGGSNEFIITNDRDIFWKESYPLGMARLLERFTPADPLDPTSIPAMHLYFEQSLASLDKALEIYPVDTLVGASGSFDTFVKVLHKKGLMPGLDLTRARALPLPLDTYRELHRELLASTARERSLMPGMEPVRVDMIVLATLFVTYILDRYKIKTLYQSPYALKEGVAGELVDKNR